MTSLPAFDEIAENLSFLEEWQDRDQYVMELGAMLPPLTDAERIAANKVSGCQSQVWVVSESDGDLVRFRADSDARLVKGRAAILVALLSGRPAAEVVAADPEQAFADIGLRANLSIGRANGLRSMIARMKADAARIAARA